MILRKVRPMLMPSTQSVTPLAELGKLPTLAWCAPTELWIDGTYQRDLSRKSLSLIRSLVANFRWNRFKPPIVVMDAGKWHVVDGQHTAIAAATLDIEAIPVFVVEAAHMADRARAFVGHNTDRIVVSAINIHQALVAAGDEDECDVALVCKRAGVRVRQYSQSSLIEVGDTKAVGLIRRLIVKHGVIKSREVLQTLVQGQCAPLGGAEIRAAEDILLGPVAYSKRRLAAAVRVEGSNGIAIAKGDAAKRKAPFWRVLRDRWLSRMQDNA